MMMLMQRRYSLIKSYSKNSLLSKTTTCTTSTDTKASTNDPSVNNEVTKENMATQCSFNDFEFKETLSLHFLILKLLSLFYRLSEHVWFFCCYNERDFISEIFKSYAPNYSDLNKKETLNILKYLLRNKDKRRRVEKKIDQLILERLIYKTVETCLACEEIDLMYSDTVPLFKDYLSDGFLNDIKGYSDPNSQSSILRLLECLHSNCSRLVVMHSNWHNNVSVLFPDADTLLKEFSYRRSQSLPSLVKLIRLEIPIEFKLFDNYYASIFKGHRFRTFSGYLALSINDSVGNVSIYKSKSSGFTWKYFKNILSLQLNRFFLSESSIADFYCIVSAFPPVYSSSPIDFTKSFTLLFHCDQSFYLLLRKYWLDSNTEQMTE